MGIKQIARNKRAGYDFELKEKLEAGIALRGTEVKSLRAGKCTINESHITIDGNFEIWLHNMSIPHYEFGNIHNHEESRKRKLLVHKDQIKELYHEVKAGGLTLIPVQIYFKDSKVKVEIALARGKKKHDKRESDKKKDIEKKLRQRDYT